MPRLPRVNYPNAVYHVTARGNGRATIFFEDTDRHRFLRQLCDSLEADSVLLYAYVLMDNTSTCWHVRMWRGIIGSSPKV